MTTFELDYAMSAGIMSVENILEFIIRTVVTQTLNRILNIQKLSKLLHYLWVINYVSRALEWWDG